MKPLLVVFIAICGLSYALYTLSEVEGAEYRFTPPSPPPPPDIVIEIEAKVNGIPITLGIGKCTPTVSTAMDIEDEPYNFTSPPKGYKCSPDPARGMRTLRIEEADRYKKLLKEWSTKKNHGVKRDE